MTRYINFPFLHVLALANSILMCKISLKWLNFDLKASSSSHAAQPTDQGQEPPGCEKSLKTKQIGNTWYLWTFHKCMFHCSTAAKYFQVQADKVQSWGPSPEAARRLTIVINIVISHQPCCHHCHQSLSPQYHQCQHLLQSFTMIPVIVFVMMIVTKGWRSSVARQMTRPTITSSWPRSSSSSAIFWQIKS